MFYSFAPAFRLLKNASTVKWEAAPAYELKSKVEHRMLSPSGLEALSKCALYFHFQRENAVR